MNLQDLKIKRTTLLESLNKLHQDSSKDGLSHEKAKLFNKMAEDFDILTAEIRHKELKDWVNSGNQIQSDDQEEKSFSLLNRSAAKRTLFEGFTMLARGERSKIDNQLLSELGHKYGLIEERTEYPSTNIVQTNLTNVYLELVKDDRFLSLIPSQVVNESYLKIPLVTRANYPAAEGKAQDVAASGTDTNFTSLTMQPKNQYVLNRFHKDLIRDGGTRAMDAIWESSRAAINKKLVEVVLYGNTSNEGEFMGLDNLSGSTIYDTSGASITDYSLITRGLKTIQDYYGDQPDLITLVNPNTYKKFMDLRELSSSGSYLNPPAGIASMPYYVNPQIKTNYSTDKTKLYMLRPASSFMAMFGNFELELNERYADFDHAAALIVLRTDFAFLDAKHLFIATNIPTA